MQFSYSANAKSTDTVRMRYEIGNKHITKKKKRAQRCYRNSEALAHAYLRLKLLTSHGQLSGVSLSVKRLITTPCPPGLSGSAGTGNSTSDHSILGLS